MTIGDVIAFAGLFVAFFTICVTYVQAEDEHKRESKNKREDFVSQIVINLFEMLGLISSRNEDASNEIKAQALKLYALVEAKGHIYLSDEEQKLISKAIYQLDSIPERCNFRMLGEDKNEKNGKYEKILDMHELYIDLYDKALKQVLEIRLMLKIK